MTDMAINPVSNVPNAGALSKKPPHLIVLGGVGKNKDYFISIDKPEMFASHVIARGFRVISFSTEEDISKNYLDLLANEPKENIEEVFLPMHRIYKIKNLVFKAK